MPSPVKSSLGGVVEVQNVSNDSLEKLNVDYVSLNENASYFTVRFLAS